jgi:hypothetical protein
MTTATPSAVLATIQPVFTDAGRVPEWHAVLDALRKLDDIGAGTPAGPWAVSLGGRPGAGGGG